MLSGLFLILLSLVALASGVGSLVCFIMVLVQMFKRGEQTMGIVCIVLAFCTGIGTLVAFVYGWVKASEWGIKKLMMVWTACFLASALFTAVYMAISVMYAAPLLNQGQLQQLQ